MALSARLALLARTFHFISFLGTRSTSLFVYLIIFYTSPRNTYSVTKNTFIINIPQVKKKALRKCCTNTDTFFTKKSLF